MIRYFKIISCYPNSEEMHLERLEGVDGAQLMTTADQTGPFLFKIQLVNLLATTCKSAAVLFIAVCCLLGYSIEALISEIKKGMGDIDGFMADKWTVQWIVTQSHPGFYAQIVYSFV